MRVFVQNLLYFPIFQLLHDSWRRQFDSLSGKAIRYDSFSWRLFQKVVSFFIDTKCFIVFKRDQLFGTLFRKMVWLDTRHLWFVRQVVMLLLTSSGRETESQSRKMKMPGRGSFMHKCLFVSGRTTLTRTSQTSSNPLELLRLQRMPCSHPICATLSWQRTMLRRTTKVVKVIKGGPTEVSTFYQHSTSSYCACRSRKHKKTVKSSVFFAILGSASVKAANRILMKLTPGLLSSVSHHPSFNSD